MCGLRKHTKMAAEFDISPYIIPADTPISTLDCTKAFEGLTDEEKLYSYHLSRACWEGAVICLYQTSPESPAIFMLFQRLFSAQDLSTLRTSAVNDGGLTEPEYNVRTYM